MCCCVVLVKVIVGCIHITFPMELPPLPYLLSIRHKLLVPSSPTRDMTQIHAHIVLTLSTLCPYNTAISLCLLLPHA